MVKKTNKRLMITIDERKLNKIKCIADIYFNGHVSKLVNAALSSYCLSIGFDLKEKHE